jgi:hypothetical protein
VALIGRIRRCPIRQNLPMWVFGAICSPLEPTERGSVTRSSPVNCEALEVTHDVLMLGHVAAHRAALALNTYLPTGTPVLLQKPLGIFHGWICLDLVRLGFDPVRLGASLRLKTIFGYYRLPLVTIGYYSRLSAVGE